MNDSFWSMEHLSPEAVSAYVNDAVPNYVRIRIERHLAQCSECCRHVQDQQAARATLQAAEPLGMPGSLRKKLSEIPTNDQLLLTIAQEQGEDAAERYAVENNLVTPMHSLAQSTVVRADIRELVVRVRCWWRRRAHAVEVRWHEGWK